MYIVRIKNTNKYIRRKRNEVTTDINKADIYKTLTAAKLGIAADNLYGIPSYNLVSYGIKSFDELEPVEVEIKIKNSNNE